MPAPGIVALLNSPAVLSLEFARLAACVLTDRIASEVRRRADDSRDISEMAACLRLLEFHPADMPVASNVASYLLYASMTASRDAIGTIIDEGGVTLLLSALDAVASAPVHFASRAAAESGADAIGYDIMDVDGAAFVEPWQKLATLASFSRTLELIAKAFSTSHALMFQPHGVLAILSALKACADAEESILEEACDTIFHLVSLAVDFLGIRSPTLVSAGAVSLLLDVIYRCRSSTDTALRATG
jgi:hypothetical protein